MRSSIDEAGTRKLPRLPTLTQLLRACPWLPLVAVMLAAVAIRPLVADNADVSWLITVSEKMLAGQRLYVDLMEINPPGSAFLYLPAVALAQAIGVRPELLVDTFVFLAIGFSLWLSGRALRRAGLLDGVDGWRLAALVAVILAILPAQTFGEREHIVIIVLLPAFAVWAVRLKGLAPDRVTTVLAGLGIGIALSIKPHFVLAIAPAVIGVALLAKSWRPIFGLENWIGGAVTAVYAASVVVFFPEFFDMLPVIVAVYVPARLPLHVLIVQCPLWVLAALWLRLIALWKPGALRAPTFAPLLAAAAGFGVVVLIQGKGWPYHTYPALAAILIVAAVVFSARDSAAGPGVAVKTWWERRLQAGLAVGLAVSVFAWMNFGVSSDAMLKSIQRAVSQPRMLVISADVAVGHPLVRRLAGSWVSRIPSLWMTAGALTLAAEAAPDAATAQRLAAYADRERGLLTEDIRRNQPDIIVVDRTEFDWYAWALADPGLAAELAAFQELETVQKYLILRRQNRRLSDRTGGSVENGCSGAVGRAYKIVPMAQFMPIRLAGRGLPPI